MLGKEIETIIPITSDLRAKVLADFLKVFGSHFRKSGMTKNHTPGHYRCNLAVKIKSFTEVEEVREIGFRKIPCLRRRSVQVDMSMSKWHVWAFVEIWDGRTRCHEGMTTWISF